MDAILARGGAIILLEAGAILKRTLLALAIFALALVPLTHHQAPPVAADGVAIEGHHSAPATAVADAQSPVTDHHKAPCHACRVFGAILPEPPYPLDPTHGGSIEVSFALASPAYGGAPLTPHNPRAPPDAG